MMAGRGFDKVINLTGGIKAWESDQAVGPEDEGLSLFQGGENLEVVLAAAYSLEQGLLDFYQSMSSRVEAGKARDLFTMLAGIEVKHMERIYEVYRNLGGGDQGREVFEQRSVAGVVEGGLTTDEYLSRFKPDLESVADIVSLAMSIEAQALDLYQRAARQAEAPDSSKALSQIAEEERAHLTQLGGLLG